MPETEAAENGAVEGVAPYRATVTHDDGQWHLTVDSLDDHPDRGEVDSLVVTVTPDSPGEDFPAADLDRVLRQCGFAREGDWADAAAPVEAVPDSEPDPDARRRTAPCRQAEAGAAPPPVPPEAPVPPEPPADE